MSTQTTRGHTRPARAVTRPQTSRADATGPGRRPRSRAESTARARLAGHLSAAGVPYAEIAPLLEYSTAASAQRAAARAAAEHAADHVTTIRAAMLPILDRIIANAMEEMHTDRPRMHRGRPILTDPDDPDSVIINPWPKLRAISRALRAMDQRAELLGLYPSHPGPRISRVHPYR